MANTKHGLPQTKGFFKLKGLAAGVGREKAFTHKEYDNGGSRNSFSFGVQTSLDSTVYVNVEGYKNNKVYLFKRSEVKGQKGEQKQVEWANRYDYVKDGFNPMGVSVGLAKDIEGKNITTTYLDYDAANKVQEQLDDEMPIFVRGDIEYSSFKKDDGEIRRNKKFVVKNVYNSKEIDFETEDFKETAEFKQKIIYTGITKSDEKGDTKFILEAKIVTYSSIEDAEFIVYNTSLANQFKKNLKPYQSLDVWGIIFNKVDSDDVQEEVSVWGEEDTFKRANKSYIRELVIIGADPATIDKETYTESTLEEALNKLRNEGQVESSTWGDGGIDIKDDDLPW
ncbi:hypothetical protein [Bacillus xiapuensis]|uniref:Uncharacterized protein n=1 Tax=Bacillus xiapuensis TaxID=2014075 RepID=A0ABU6N8F5_9BACI|nr:hypothetical protein [Bacillus xiapuensis]